MVDAVGNIGGGWGDVNKTTRKSACLDLKKTKAYLFNISVCAIIRESPFSYFLKGRTPSADLKILCLYHLLSLNIPNLVV